MGLSDLISEVEQLVDELKSQGGKKMLKPITLTMFVNLVTNFERMFRLVMRPRLKITCNIARINSTINCEVVWLYTSFNCPVLPIGAIVLKGI